MDGGKSLVTFELPVKTNIVLKDLVNRIYHDKDKPEADYLPLIDFIRRSWQELPPDTSGASFMKPACLVSTFGTNSVK